MILNILKVIQELKKREYLADGEFRLTVNGNQNFGSTYSNPLTLKDVDVDDIEQQLFMINIEGYNLTIKTDINPGGEYKPGWKSVDYVFWSGIDSDSDLQIDTNKYGKFEWFTLGTRESFSTNGIRDKMREIIFDDEGDKVIYSNYFEYEKVGEVIDNLIELDKLLDEQEAAKQNLYEKLKLNLQ